jgi:hypothetical protein
MTPPPRELRRLWAGGFVRVEVLDPSGGGEGGGGGGGHLPLQGGASDDFKVERNSPPRHP